MRTLSLNLRSYGQGDTLEPHVTRAALVSAAGHACFLTALVVFPLLEVTEPPETASAFQAPLVRPVMVALPPAPRIVSIAPSRSAKRSASPNRVAPSQQLEAPEQTPAGIRVDDVLDPGPATPVGSGEGDPSGRGGASGDCELGALCGNGSIPAVAVAAPSTPRVGGLIREPRLIESRAPVYPSIAQVAGVSGKVVLEAHVSKDGRVIDARVLTGESLFNEAALTSARSRRYEALLLNGVPTDFLVTITVVFSLRR